MPIAILIAVVLIIAGGILAWQYFGAPKEEAVEDETVDWEIYRNEEYGYEIKYPQDWKFEGEWGAPPSPMFTYRWNDGGYCRFNVVVTSVDDSGAIAGFIEKGYEQTTYTIDGILGIKLTKSPQDPQDYIYFSKNLDYYRITKFSSKDIHEIECIEKFYQILSTFKFIGLEGTKE